MELKDIDVNLRAEFGDLQIQLEIIQAKYNECKRKIAEELNRQPAPEVQNLNPVKESKV